MTNLDSCIGFLQKLIQTPSLPGEEGQLANLVKTEMENLGFDRVFADQAGNIIGLVEGQGQAPPMMFNTHLDHVDAGASENWPYPPFSGEIHDGKIWGRGAVDIKGPLAAQVYAVASLIARGKRPPGDVFVSSVVQEEVGGLGARFLVSHLKTPYVVVGEPSSNELRRGHRGRLELILHVHGRSVHASVPAQGVNPLEVIASFITAMKGLQMRSHPDLGYSSVAPTLIETDQISSNVIPSEVWLTCDWRNVAAETAEEIQQKLQHIATQSVIEGARAEVKIPSFERVSYSGLRLEMPADNPPFVVAATHPAIISASSILENAIGLNLEPKIWRFATDGGHFAKAGMTVIGFGPGHENLAHTIDESIEIAALETAIIGNQALALQLTSRIAASS